jgi:hypothetical protein
VNTFFADIDDAIEMIRSGKLSQAEIALAVSYLAETHKSPAISLKTGISATNVRHLVRLARKLDPEVLEKLHLKAISPSIARALAALPADQQREQARRVSLVGTSVHSLRAQLAGRPDLAKAKRDADDHYEQLARYMSDRTGLAISIEPDPKQRNAGELRIKFTDLQDFDVIVDRLRVDLSEL